MRPTLFWLQGQTCGGNTISLLNATDPDFSRFLDDSGIELLYHPSLSPLWGRGLMTCIRSIASGRTPLDILVFEGAIPRGPRGTGEYCTLDDRPVKDVAMELVPRARYVVAIGNCASHGGLAATAPNPTGATGLQWEGTRHGGLVGPGFRSRSGLPVICLTGCPVPPRFITATLTALAREGLAAADLDTYQRPRFLYDPTGDGACGYPPPASCAIAHLCNGCARPGWPTTLEEVLPAHVASHRQAGPAEPGRGRHRVPPGGRL